MINTNDLKMTTSLLAKSHSKRHPKIIGLREVPKAVFRTGLEQRSETLTKMAIQVI
jgi:hypothetical protein